MECVRQLHRPSASKECQHPTRLAYIKTRRLPCLPHEETQSNEKKADVVGRDSTLRLEDLTKMKPEKPEHGIQNPPANVVEHICLVDAKDCQFHR
jgi:hypothetical protein